MSTVSPARPFIPLSLVLLFTLLSSCGASARVWNVNADGTGDAPTIQAAVDSAAAGDDIVVAPGTYKWTEQGHTDDYGMIFFKAHAGGFTLRSSHGADATILDAQFRGRVMFLQGPNHIVIDGFTFINGTAPISYDAGGGLIGHLGDPVIRNCVFTNNTAQQGGALWFGGVSSPTIEDCLFYDNRAYYGGAVCLVNSSETGRLRDCVIRGNYAEARGGGLVAHNYDFRIEYSAVCGNTCDDRGGAISISENKPAEIFHCTLSRNDAPDGSGIQLQGSANINVSCSIISFGRSGAAVSLWNDTSIEVEDCVLWQNSGGDSIPAPGTSINSFIIDPQFCGSPDSGNWTLQADSPCLPGNHSVGQHCLGVGAYRSGCGTVSTERSTWGSIRKRFRK